MHLNFLFKKDNDNVSKKGKVNVPDGLFTKCPKCSKMILTDELFLDNCVCHSCGYYFKIDAKTRISMVIDKDTFEEWDTGIEEKNPCDFEGYIQKTADSSAVFVFVARREQRCICKKVRAVFFPLRRLLHRRKYLFKISRYILRRRVQILS